MLLARDGGLRHKAIREFTLANCDFENRTVSGRTKPWSTYNVPMTHRLYEKLLWAAASLKDPEMPILQQFNRAWHPITPGNIDHKLKLAKEAAGAKGKWGMHDLRRTGARAIYAQTKDIQKVQRFLGHLNPQHSWWYLGLNATELTHADVEAASHSQPKEAVA
jgi:integrase